MCCHSHTSTCFLQGRTGVSEQHKTSEGPINTCARAMQCRNDDYLLHIELQCRNIRKDVE